MHHKVACGHAPFTCGDMCKLHFPLVLAQSDEYVKLLKNWADEGATASVIVAGIVIVTVTAIVTATVIATAKVGSATGMAARHAIENASARATEVFAARVDVRRPG